MWLIYRFFFPAMWLSWAAYWFVAAKNVKTTERTEPIKSRLMHVVPQLIAFWLLFARHVPIPFLNIRLFPRMRELFWVGSCLTAVGLLFSVWARRYIGRNWSGKVTLKEDHNLVTSGPYALVRHPIYAGLLLAFMGSVAACNEWRGVLAVLIAWLALWRKYRFEERWMLERFGAQYREYVQRVPALLPVVKRFRRSGNAG